MEALEDTNIQVETGTSDVSYYPLNIVDVELDTYIRTFRVGETAASLVYNDGRSLALHPLSRVHGAGCRWLGRTYIGRQRRSLLAEILAHAESLSICSI